MLVGLVMGVLLGLALQLIYGENAPVLEESIAWFNVVGNGYVQLLQMIVMPLIFASILSAVARLHNASSLRKISVLTIVVLLLHALQGDSDRRRIEKARRARDRHESD